MPDTYSTVLPTDLEGDVLAEVDVSRHSQVIQFQHVWNSLKTVHEVTHLQITWACAWGGRRRGIWMNLYIASFLNATTKMAIKSMDVILQPSVWARPSNCGTLEMREKRFQNIKICRMVGTPTSGSQRTPQVSWLFHATQEVVSCNRVYNLTYSRYGMSSALIVISSYILQKVT